MKKKIYQQPEMEVVELDQADIIATSNEGLEEGDSIFGARNSFFDDEDF